MVKIGLRGGSFFEKPTPGIQFGIHLLGWTHPHLSIATGGPNPGGQRFSKRPPFEEDAWDKQLDKRWPARFAEEFWIGFPEKMACDPK